MPLALTIDNDTNYFDDNQAQDAMQRYWSAMQAGSEAKLSQPSVGAQFHPTPNHRW